MFVIKKPLGKQPKGTVRNDMVRPGSFSSSGRII